MNFKLINQIIIFIFIYFSIYFASNHDYPKNWELLHNNLDWKLVKKTEQVSLYTKNLPDSPLSAYKVELISNINMHKLLDAAWLVEKSAEIFPSAFISESGIYNKINDTSYTAYQIFKIPFLSPRLYQFNSIKSRNMIHWIKTDTININPNNLLLPPVNFGSWKVVSKNGKSKLTYLVCTNPGGNIPHWMINKVNSYYLPMMLIDLEQFVLQN